jgi:hypothetical protein
VFQTNVPREPLSFVQRRPAFSQANHGLNWRKNPFVSPEPKLSRKPQFLGFGQVCYELQRAAAFFTFTPQGVNWKFGAAVNATKRQDFHY